MDQRCATPQKQQLVRVFDDLAVMILKALMEMECLDDCSDACKELVIAMQELNAMAKKIDWTISGTYVENTLYGTNLYIDSNVEKKMNSNLKEVLTDLVNILSQINDVLASGYDKRKKASIEKSIGKILLMLRFDILSLPEEAINDADMGNVYEQVKLLGIMNNDHFLVRHLWDRSSRKFLPQYDDADVAIVMQGPINYEENFTLETLMRYRKIYPNISIILSTWEGEVAEEFRILAEAVGIDIVENQKPSDGGPWNIKYQIISSLGGVLQAEKRNYRYVLKTRTDQAFFHPEFIVYMKNMLKTFPVNCENLSERIVFMGAQNSMCTYPFRITDFMSFGRLEDIKKLYSCSTYSERLEYTSSDDDIKIYHRLGVLGRTPFDNYSVMCSMDESDRQEIIRKIGMKQDPESYIIQSFYERVISKKNLSENDDILLHYWRFIKNCTIFIDGEELLFLWMKYSAQFMNLSSNISDGGLNHATWMQIYYSDRF